MNMAHKKKKTGKMRGVLWGPPWAGDEKSREKKTTVTDREETNAAFSFFFSLSLTERGSPL